MRCRTWIGLSAVVVFAAGATSLLGSAPADATRPENDRIVQLERQVADLQRRLERLEANQGVRPAVQYFPPNVQYFTPAPQSLPGSPVPAPLPDPNEKEINGVKYRVFLLGEETKIRR